MTLDVQGQHGLSGQQGPKQSTPTSGSQTSLVKGKVKGKPLSEQQQLLSPDNPQSPVRSPLKRKDSLSTVEGLGRVSQSPFVQKDLEQGKQDKPKEKVTVDPKEAFKNGIQPLVNHIPPTGIGKFDMVWNPDTGALDVLVKIHLGFKPETEEEKRQKFRDDFKTNIEKAWNTGIVIQSIKPGWEEFTAVPNIQVVLTDKPAGSHFTMDVNENKDIQKLEDGTPVGETAQIDGHDQVDPRNTPTHGHYDLSHANVSVAGTDKANKWLAFGEAERVKGILKALGLDEIQFHTHGDELDTMQEAKLVTLARQAATEVREKAGVPVALKAEGFCSKREYFDRNLRQRRVDRVTGLLEANNQEGKLLLAKSLGADHESKVTLKVDDSFVEKWHTKKIVACHEFGHMLGLPDMYGVGNSERVQNQQQAYSKLLRKAGGGGQFKPQEFTKTTASMMSAGTLVFKDYYVTLVHALSKITTRGTEQIKYGQWKIQ